MEEYKLFLEARALWLLWRRSDSWRWKSKL